MLERPWGLWFGIHDILEWTETNPSWIAKDTHTYKCVSSMYSQVCIHTTSMQVHIHSSMYTQTASMQVHTYSNMYTHTRTHIFLTKSVFSDEEGNINLRASHFLKSTCEWYCHTAGWLRVTMNTGHFTKLKTPYLGGFTTKAWHYLNLMLNLTYKLHNMFVYWMAPH